MSLFFLFLFSYQTWPVPAWQTRSAEAVGLDPQPIQNMLRAARDGDHGPLHSIVLVKNGFLVAEAYFPSDPLLPSQIGRGNGPHQLQSVSKSVLSLVVGRAVQRGLLSTQEPLANYLGEAMAVRNDTWNPTLRDLLTMRHGLQWHQWSRRPRHERDHVRLLAEPNWQTYILSRPLSTVAEGPKFVYSDASPLLLAAAIGAASGNSFESFAEEALFKPLGIQASWQLRDAHNLVHTGGGLAMTSRDAAKLGLLLARGGKWQQQQLIDPAYLKEATKIHVTKPFPSSQGLRGKLAYGYLWWLFPDEDHVIPFAVGLGEQGILVNPQRDLVLVTTGWIQDRAHALKVLQLYLQYLKPAMAK